MDYYNMMKIVKEEIEKNEILIFTKKGCGYCDKSLHLLNSLNLKYKNIVLKGVVSSDNVETVEFILHSLTGQRTVPNIFIRGKHMGGCTELFELYNNKQLFVTLGYSNCGYCNKLQSRETICECLQTIKYTDEWGKDL